jgi:hypothetical protein
MRSGSLTSSLLLLTLSHSEKMMSAESTTNAAHQLAQNVPASAARSHSAGSASREPSRSSGSASRVRVHNGSPELSIVLHGDDTDQALGEEQKQTGGHLSPPASVGHFSDEGDEGGSLKQNVDRSRRTTTLLRELDGWMVSDAVVNDRRLTKEVREYYAASNELVESFKNIARLEEAESAAERLQKEESEVAQSGAVKLAIEGSLILTIILIILKFSAAIYSGSIAVIASAVDSGLDLVSQGTLVCTSRFMRKKDPVTFPIGEKRLHCTLQCRLSCFCVPWAYVSSSLWCSC